MKMISRLFAVVIAALIGVFCAPNAGGQTKTVVAPPDSFPFGSMEKVEKYAASQVQWIGIYTSMYDTNNKVVGYSSFAWQGPKSSFTNKIHLEIFLADALKVIFKGFLTNQQVPQNIDRGKGLRLSVHSCAIAEYIGDSRDIFLTPNYVYLKPGVSNGIYTIPDTSSFTMKINSSIPFHVPNIHWARLEVRMVGDLDPFEVYDKNIDPTMNLIGSDGFMYIKTSLISESSSEYGSIRLKLSIASRSGGGYFRSFDGDGKLLPETPIRLDISNYSEEFIALTVKGGDSGRAFVLQESSDLINWSNSYGIGTTFIPAFQHLGVEPYFYLPKMYGMCYRIKTVNVTP